MIKGNNEGLSQRTRNNGKGKYEFILEFSRKYVYCEQAETGNYSTQKWPEIIRYILLHYWIMRHCR